MGLREATPLELVAELTARIWSDDPPRRRQLERLLVHAEAAAAGITREQAEADRPCLNPGRTPNRVPGI